MQVLIADDDSLLRRLLRFWLEARGFAVDEAADGAQALERLAAAGTLPDVLVLDAVMPGVDGSEVLRRLRVASSGTRLPVLMLTATRDETEIAALRALGADDVLTKPLLPDVLVARIRSLADAARAGRTGS